MVVFSVLDHHIRRPDADRVIGVLLGNISDETGIVEIRNCFPVPHGEGEQISMNVDHYKKMMELHQRLSPDDVTVGWYTTGDFVKPSAVLFQKFFRREMNQEPVHLMVGTDLSTGSISINTYYNMVISFTDSLTHNHFVPLPFDYVTSEHERAALDVLGTVKEGQSQPLSDLASLERALLRLQETISILHTHVGDIIAGKAPQNIELGRFLQHTLSLLPSTDISFETMFTNGTLDTLMLIYLANLTRSHLFLAEKNRDQSS
jgi:translation initiation factor 3 subunit F